MRISTVASLDREAATPRHIRAAQILRSAADYLSDGIAEESDEEIAAAEDAMDLLDRTARDIMYSGL